MAMIFYLAPHIDQEWRNIFHVTSCFQPHLRHSSIDCKSIFPLRRNVEYFLKICLWYQEQTAEWLKSEKIVQEFIIGKAGALE